MLGPRYKDGKQSVVPACCPGLQAPKTIPNLPQETDPWEYAERARGSGSHAATRVSRNEKGAAVAIALRPKVVE